MRVTWRTATEEDVAFLTDVAVLTLQDQGRWPEGEDEAEYRAGYADWTRQQLRGVEPDSELYVLERDCVRVGRLRVVRPGAVVEVAGLQVLPVHQGQGIGTDVVRRWVRTLTPPVCHSSSGWRRTTRALARSINDWGFGRSARTTTRSACDSTPEPPATESSTRRQVSPTARMDP